jgi:hypothetical protein
MALRSLPPSTVPTFIAGRVTSRWHHKAASAGGLFHRRPYLFRKQRLHGRKTVARLALRVGRGCAELHDRLMVGIRVNRLELDEAWSFVGKKQKYVLRHEIPIKSEQYVFIGMANAEGDHRLARRQA